MLLALARQLTLLALARLARQLKSLDFPHTVPVNNIAGASWSATRSHYPFLEHSFRQSRELKIAQNGKEILFFAYFSL